MKIRLKTLFAVSLLMFSVALIGAAIATAVTAQEQAATAPIAAAVEQDRQAEALTEEQQQLVRSLEEQLPSGSEARLMLDAILAGNRMGPNDGWFAAAKPDTRYSWENLLERFDANLNQRIEQDEFPGGESDFSIVDRNRDHVISQEDLAWEATRGSGDFSRVMSELDPSRDGRIEREELLKHWERLVGERDSISAEELRQAWFPNEAPTGQRRGEPDRATLLMGLARQEIGSWNEGPEIDETAPDFELKTVEGQAIRLSEQLGEKPIVLIFGNYTCGPFRGQAGNVLAIHERFKDRATFLMVYVREAHPEDGWRLPSNSRNQVAVMQPKSFDERREVAEVCRQHFLSEIPMLVDSLDDSVGHAYSGGPARLYLIDRAGKVVYKGGRGPHYFFPSQLESSLVWLLNESP